MVKKCHKWFKIVFNDPKWLKIQNSSQLSTIVQYGKNGPQWTRMVSKTCPNGKNGKKWLKMVLHGQMW